MKKGEIIRELSINPNTTLIVSVTNPEQITPIGTLYDCTWIFTLTNNPNKTLEALNSENGVCSFQASWRTLSLKHAVETCIEFSENSFKGTGCFEFELREGELDIHDLIYIAVYVRYAYMPCMVTNGN